MKKKNNEVDINDFIEILRQGYIISLGEDKNAKQFEEISTEVEQFCKHELKKGSNMAQIAYDLYFNKYKDNRIMFPYIRAYEILKRRNKIDIDFFYSKKIEKIISSTKDIATQIDYRESYLSNVFDDITLGKDMESFDERIDDTWSEYCIFWVDIARIYWNTYALLYDTVPRWPVRDINESVNMTIKNHTFYGIETYKKHKEFIETQIQNNIINSNDFLFAEILNNADLSILNNIDKSAYEENDIDISLLLFTLMIVYLKDHLRVVQFSPKGADRIMASAMVAKNKEEFDSNTVEEIEKIKNKEASQKTKNIIINMLIIWHCFIYYYFGLDMPDAFQK